MVRLALPSGTCCGILPQQWLQNAARKALPYDGDDMIDLKEGYPDSDDFAWIIEDNTVMDRVETLPSGNRILLPACCGGGAIQYNVKMLRAVLRDNGCSVLITGETGTGKEAIFQCIKELSPCAGNVREINCAGLTDERLVESELFGHVKGAFTGADGKRCGLVKTCENGILFLDEFGWLPKAVQAKLLRFMESGCYRPVGSDDVEKSKNVRIVAATNQGVSTDLLLPDLIHRFDHHIDLPPLRERGSDIFWFLSQPGFLGGQEVYTGISLRTLIGLLCHEWKGNIRELAKYCKRKTLFRSCEVLAEREKYHILDDEDLADLDNHCLWLWMARFALASAEKEESEKPKTVIFAEHLRTLGILNEIWTNEGRHLSRYDEIEYSAGIVIPINGLEERLYAGSAYWRTDAVENWLKSAGLPVHHDEDGIYFVTTAAPCLADLLIELRRICKSMAVPEAGTGATWAEPSRAWCDYLKKIPLVQALYGVEVPEPDRRFEDGLDRAGLEAVTKSVCRLCKEGKSAQEISIALGVGAPKKSTITKMLSDIRRRHPELAAYLPVARRGRRAKVCRVNTGR